MCWCGLMLLTFQNKRLKTGTGCRIMTAELITLNTFVDVITLILSLPPLSGCSPPSVPVSRSSNGPLPSSNPPSSYLLSGAAVKFLRLLEQTVVLDEAIFTGFSPARCPVTGLSVQQLVGGALRHLRRPVAVAGWFRVWSWSTCVTSAVKSCMSWRRSGSDERPLTEERSPRSSAWRPAPGASWLVQTETTATKIIYTNKIHHSDTEMKAVM